MNRVSYHQNVFDLIDIDPLYLGTRPEWSKNSSVPWRELPASVREWYGFEATVPGSGNISDQGWSGGHYAAGRLWYDYSEGDNPWSWESLHAQLRWEAANGKRPVRNHLYVMTDRAQRCNWLVWREGWDPLTWRDNGSRSQSRWQREGTFSDFVFDWIARHYLRPGTPLSGQPGYNGPAGPWAFREKKYLNGLWLRSPREPALPPPMLDLLLESFNDEQRQLRPGGPTTHRFTGPGMSLTVTTDAWDDPEGHSAWWLHAQTPEALAEMARRVWPVGTLAYTLRAMSDPGKQLLERLRAVG